MGKGAFIRKFGQSPMRKDGIQTNLTSYFFENNTPEIDTSKNIDELEDKKKEQDLQQNDNNTRLFQYNHNKIVDKFGIDVENSGELKILFAHDNRKDYFTTLAHKLADLVDHHPNFNKIVDYDVWNKGEKTSDTETNNREKQMVQDSDLIVRLIPPASKVGPRNEGAIREINKAINAGKPILEIYLSGARDSPNRSDREKKYSKRVEIHLAEKQVLLKGFLDGLKSMQEKGLLTKNLKFKE